MERADAGDQAGRAPEVRHGARDVLLFAAYRAAIARRYRAMRDATRARRRRRAADTGRRKRALAVAWRLVVAACGGGMVACGGGQSAPPKGAESFAADTRLV